MLFPQFFPLSRKKRRRNSPAFICMPLRLFGRRSRNGANLCASAAINAGVSVNYILAVALGNSLYGAAICAGAAGDAVITNYICHIKVPPFYYFYYIVTY